MLYFLIKFKRQKGKEKRIMKTLILFYSYTGNSKRFAENLSKKIGADIEEVKTDKRPGTIAAYVLGSLSAMRQKSVIIKPIQADIRQYDHFILIAPIWAGNPAPAFNSMIDKLSAKKSVELYFISGSGNSNKDKISSNVENKGFKIFDYHNIKQNTIND